MKILINCIVIFFLFSCSGRQNVPSDILKPEKMKNIMWDLLQAQSLSAELAARDSLVDKQVSLNWLTNQAFRLNQTDSVNYNKSYEWYIAHPGIMKLFLDSLYQQKQRNKDLILPKVHKQLIH